MKYIERRFFKLSLPMQLTETDAGNVTKMHLEDNNAIPYTLVA